MWLRRRHHVHAVFVEPVTGRAATNALTAAPLRLQRVLRAITDQRGLVAATASTMRRGSSASGPSPMPTATAPSTFAPTRAQHARASRRPPRRAGRSPLATTSRPPCDSASTAARRSDRWSSGAPPLNPRWTIDVPRGHAGRFSPAAHDSTATRSAGGPRSCASVETPIQAILLRMAGGVRASRARASDSPANDPTDPPRELVRSAWSSRRKPNAACQAVSCLPRPRPRRSHGPPA